MAHMPLTYDQLSGPVSACVVMIYDIDWCSERKKTLMNFETKQKNTNEIIG